MSLSDAFAFAATMFVVAASPGPGVFATTSRALASGPAHGAIVALGIVTGDLVYLLLAVYGLAALAAALGGFFIVVQYIGGACLLWLGLKSWNTKAQVDAIHGLHELSWKANYMSGLLVTLGNPKAVLFYLGFLPGFVDLNSLSQTDVLAIALIIALVLGSVMLAYACAAGYARKLFTHPAAHSLFNKAAGAVMLALGAGLIVRASAF